MADDVALPRSLSTARLSAARSVLRQLAEGDLSGPADSHLLAAVLAGRSVCLQVCEICTVLDTVVVAPDHMFQIPRIAASGYFSHPGWRRVASAAGLPLRSLHLLSTLDN